MLHGGLEWLFCLAAQGMFILPHSVQVLWLGWIEAQFSSHLIGPPGHDSWTVGKRIEVDWFPGWTTGLGHYASLLCLVLLRYSCYFDFFNCFISIFLAVKRVCLFPHDSVQDLSVFFDYLVGSIGVKFPVKPLVLICINLLCYDPATYLGVVFVSWLCSACLVFKGWGCVKLFQQFFKELLVLFNFANLLKMHDKFRTAMGHF